MPEPEVRDETGDGRRPFRLSGELTEAEMRAVYDEAMRCVERARRRRERGAEVLQR
jgi:hypothetical protein